MIKAVIFDCFGVLVRGSLEQFIDTYLSHDQQLVRRAHELNDQASLGLISYDDQLREFADMANITFEQTRREMDNNPRNEILLTFITQKLRDNYKIGFLSNASDDWLEDLFTKEDMQLFDDVVLSYAVKMVKPDPRIFELAAERLGVKPEECVFIDDIERYCSAAGDIGMQAITYRNFGQMKDELEPILKMADTDK